MIHLMLVYLSAFVAAIIITLQEHHKKHFLLQVRNALFDDFFHTQLW